MNTNNHTTFLYLTGKGSKSLQLATSKLRNKFTCFIWFNFKYIQIFFSSKCYLLFPVVQPRRVTVFWKIGMYVFFNHHRISVISNTNCMIFMSFLNCHGFGCLRYLFMLLCITLSNQFCTFSFHCLLIILFQSRETTAVSFYFI